MEHEHKPAVRWLDISVEQAGQRIDNFLLRILKGVPKSRVYRLLRKGEVRVNKSRTRPDYRLQSGDRLRIPPVRTAASTGAPVAPGQTARAQLLDAVLYEDERLLIIDKPAGMAVHGGSGISSGVIETLRALRPDARELELVHRLDRDTSGCLMIAKRRSALRRLHELLREGRVEKRYFALVCGNWPDRLRHIDAPLTRNVLHSGERVVRVDPADGKPARTVFSIVEEFAHATLLDAELHTGRTHQIRVHAAHAGHPLAGDRKYGDAACNRALREQGLKRLFLHAHYLAFDDPQNDWQIAVSAPLPAELRACVQHLEGHSDTGLSSQKDGHDN